MNSSLRGESFTRTCFLVNVDICCLKYVRKLFLQYLLGGKFSAVLNQEWIAKEVIYESARI